MTHGTLFVVATPIGNLEDMTPRARQVLAAVDIVAAEDTRHTGRLLTHFGIDARQQSLHEHNEERVSATLVESLLAGRSVALVSDAGTPLISDPGFRLVNEARSAGIPVIPVPGASAVAAAVSVAGLPCDRYTFEGFLPARRQARRHALEALAKSAHTMVFFESVHRVAESIEDMRTVFGDERPAFVAREISKLHEQYVRGSLGQIAAALDDGKISRKGEFVIIVAGNHADTSKGSTVDASALLVELLHHMPGKQAVDIVSRLSGRRRNEVYREMLALGPESD